MLQSSDADGMRMHAQQINYNSSKHNSQDNTKHAQNGANYSKPVERNYRSGGSGSTSGGTSIDGINHLKNQFYSRTKLNVSDITEQVSVQHPQEDNESMFYQVQTQNVIQKMDKRRMVNRNSKDNMYLSSGRRQVVSSDISSKGSGNINNSSYQMNNKRNNSNNSMFNSNDKSGEGREAAKLYFEEQRMSTQVVDGGSINFHTNDLYRSNNDLDAAYQDQVAEFNAELETLADL